MHKHDPQLVLSETLLVFLCWLVIEQHKFPSLLPLPPGAWCRSVPMRREILTKHQRYRGAFLVHGQWCSQILPGVGETEALEEASCQGVSFPVEVPVACGLFLSGISSRGCMLRTSRTPMCLPKPPSLSGRIFSQFRSMTVTHRQ